jgi:tRNA A22 N-methylase
LLVRVIDFIADNEEEYAEYRKLQPLERRSWLRTWLRKQFHA